MHTQRKQMTPMSATDPEERGTETQAIEALKAAGWVRVDEGVWKPGLRARAPKVQGRALDACKRLMGRHATAFPPVLR